LLIFNTKVFFPLILSDYHYHSLIITFLYCNYWFIEWCT
jgi:hypothetical protein